MINRTWLALALCLLAGGAWGQSAAPSATITLSGYVRDGATGENLIGATVVRPATRQGTATNTFGFYSLTLPASPTDSAEIVVSFLGYDAQRRRVPLNRSQALDFRPRPTAQQLETAVVTGTRTEADGRIAETTRMGTINIPIAQLKQVPALLGERDVLRVLQLLPGVQSGGEGQTGLFVRGGSPDQNLMLLDGTPVYNASHLFGFFSVFNADALNNVELIKGGFPARYGGRLSSVVDITMKEGNTRKLHGEGGIGIVGARLTLEGPLGLRKARTQARAVGVDSATLADTEAPASFVVSGRRTYLDLLARPIIMAQAEGAVAGYFFHDFNAKLNWRLSRRDRLYLSGYTGYDKFYARDKTSRDGYTSENRNALGWGNLTTALRWNRELTDKLFLNTHLTYSRYQFDVRSENEDRTGQPDGSTRTQTAALRYLSNIRDWSLKSDLDWVPSPDHYVRAGAQAIWHQFRPGALTIKSETEIPENDFNLDVGTRTQAVEMGVYAEDDWRLTDRLKVNLGMRLAGFAVGGTFYPSVEPRAAARYLLTEQWGLKASYARMTQFIHLLTNNGVGLPTDLWVPSTPMVEPQRAHQVSLGVARTFARGGEDYEVTFETFYKPMRGLVEYQEGASFLGNTSSDWETKIASGKGWAYGGEVLVQKKSGRTTGWVGYTLSWSNRRFAELNQGRLFPYKYDRRHNLSVVVIHEFTPRVRLSGTFVYGTGNAVTLARGRFALDGAGGYFGQQLNIYGARNSYRMEAYHRLDLDLSFTKKKKWGEIVNSLSVYNAYSRRNPFFYLYDPGYSSNGVEVAKPTYKKYSLFPIIPSFSKSFKF
ncbi:MAG: TonB-dependent receptor [Hymenobacteraceae bacterium]|nr:TonB-dependent receptor [Hymenobacteraceae bacterium]